MKLAGKELTETGPCSAVVSAWTVGQKVLGSNPIRVMWDFSALAGSYPEVGEIETEERCGQFYSFFQYEASSTVCMR